MARDEVNIQFLDPTNIDSSVCKKVTNTTITQANGIKIKNAFAGKKESLLIRINNTYATADSTVTIKAGDKYVNKCLGDDVQPLTKSAESVIIIVDHSRFQNADGSIDLDFSENFTGTICVTATKAAGPYVAK